MRGPATLLVLVLVVGCAGGGSHAKAPDLDALRNMTYTGIEDDPVTLVDGAWEGAPYVEGSALRPTVDFVRDFVLAGDLDGDGSDEAVVMLEHATGGTGRFGILAVAGLVEGEATCLATADLGDRVKLVSAAVRPGATPMIVLELLEAGPGDGACCPRDVVTRAFTFDGSALTAVASDVPTRRVSLAELEGWEWVLRHWSFHEAASPETEVTLVYDEGRFSGTNGCNNYFMAVDETESTKISVGPGGATKMFCPDPAGEVETRFMAALGSVTDYGFMGGQLTLIHETDGEYRVLFFERREWKENR